MEQVAVQIFLVACTFIATYYTAKMADKKGRRVALWAALAACTNFIALIVLACLKKIEKPKSGLMTPKGICPNCGLKKVSN